MLEKNALSVSCSYDGANRLSYMALISSAALVISPLNLFLPPEYYFSLPLLVTMLLIVATLPLGHSLLAADLRGVLGYFFVMEVAFSITYSFDIFIDVYRALRLWYNYIDYALYTMLAGRLVWIATDKEGFVLSWPPFDFLRFFTGESTSKNKLTKQQIIAGYSMMLGCIIVGFVMKYFNAYFFIPAIFMLLALMWLFSSRLNETRALDDQDTHSYIAEENAELRAENDRLKAKVQQLEREREREDKNN